MTQKTKKCILWVDDDNFLVDYLFSELCDVGIDLITATKVDDAIILLEKSYPNVHLIVLDVMMPMGKLLGANDSLHGASRTGITLGRMIKDKYPELPILGCSFDKDPKVKRWFVKYGNGYIDKGSIKSDEVIELIQELIYGANFEKNPKCFIVHGHDHVVLLELKDYLQNTLHFEKPIVLRDEPSLGRTIIEKFEQETADIDLVFVILTPDDKGSVAQDPNEIKRRARQNVIFELGYFCGKLQRKSGRVIFLHKGGLELPSDISGLVYIDISHGIAHAGEDLRRELNKWV